MSQKREYLLIVSSIIIFSLLIFIGGGIGYIVGRTFHEALFVVVGLTIGFVTGGIIRFITFDYIYERKKLQEYLDLLD